MNGLFGLLGFNFSPKRPSTHPIALDENVMHKEVPKPPNSYKRTSQKLNHKTVPANIDVNSNIDSDTESNDSSPVPGAKRIYNRKGKSLITSTIFTQEIVNDIIYDINNNPKQRQIGYKSLENIAELHKVKVEEAKKIKKLMDKLNNVQILNHLISRKIGKPKECSDNMLALIQQKELEIGVGIGRSAIALAMNKGAMQDIREGRSTIVNPECSKNYALNGISKYLYTKIKQTLTLFPRAGRAKYGNRSEKLKEVFGHYSQAVTYALVTFVDPKEDDLGERRVTLNSNSDDVSVVFGTSLDDKFEVLISKASQDWMDEVRLNCMAKQPGDKFMRTCFHMKPVISELGRLICFIFYVKDRDKDDLKIFCLDKEILPYAFYFVIIGKNVSQEDFEVEMQLQIVIPCLDLERDRLICEYITNKHVTTRDINSLDEIEELSDEESEIIRKEAQLKFMLINHLVDGAQGLISAIKRGRLTKAAKKYKVTFIKGAAQHSMTWNALDASYCFMSLHAMSTKASKSGSISPCHPPWYEAFKKITAKHIASSERRKTIDTFASHLWHMIARCFTNESLSGGWVSNGMGIGPNGVDAFSFPKMMNHWKMYRHLPPAISAEMTRIFWQEAIPYGRIHNSTISHREMFNQLKEILDFPTILLPEEDRTMAPTNQGFAMVLNDAVFTEFAEDKLILERLITERTLRVNEAKKQEKKRLDSEKKIKNDAIAKGVDDELASSLVLSRAAEMAEIETYDKRHTAQISALKGTIPKKSDADSKATKIAINAAIKLVEEGHKEIVKEIKSRHKKERDNLKASSKKERSKIINIHHKNLFDRGANPIKINITQMDVDNDKDDNDDDDNDKYENDNDKDENDNVLDPNYWLCGMVVSSNGARCPNNFEGLCPRSKCRYSNISLCGNCLLKHKHVDT